MAGRSSLFAVSIGAFALCFAHGAPTYTAAGVVNAASNQPVLAPNALVSIYGTDLALAARAVAQSDIMDGQLPVQLGGVRVLLGVAAARSAHLYYVSPTQINFLIPAGLEPGERDLSVVRDGLAGPPVRIRLQEAAPAFLVDERNFSIATRPDGSRITSEKPAHSGEIVVLYAAALGATNPEQIEGRLPTTAAPLRKLSEFRIQLGGVDIERSQILYAGIAPGFAGLYQINLRLPTSLPADPEIRAGIGTELSPAGVKLAAR